jgi:molecular chaperone HscC
VSIIELFDGVMEVRASAGDNFLGGEDFDTLLLEHFVDSQRNATGFPPTSTVLQALRREAERVRKALGQDDSAEFALRVDGQQWVKTITQQELAKLYTPLLERLRAPIERALRDARIRVGDLDEILLVGGTTRMPLVRKLAAGLFGRFPSISLDPDQVVAHGAAIQAALKARSAALEEVVLTDVCPYTLGIETSNQYGGHIESGHYLPLIERNSSVPVSRVKSVVTLHDDQTRVLLKIYQGESRLVKDNIELGQLDIPVPKRKAGEVSLDVRFTYDNNGLLEAQVNIPLTGEQHSLVIENNPGVLNPQEIQQRLQALAQLKVHPRDQQVNTVLVARLERLYQENLGELREQLGHWAAQFQQVLDTQDERRIREARSELSRQLEQLDNGFWR